MYIFISLDYPSYWTVNICISEIFITQKHKIQREIKLRHKEVKVQVKAKILVRVTKNYIMKVYRGVVGLVAQSV